MRALTEAGGDFYIRHASNDSLGSRLSPEQRRAQIVEIAAEHFSRDGAAGASMSRIAVAAGVTRALVYHYFPGKEALLEAVLEREASRVLLATAPDPTMSQRQNIERALTAFFDHFAASSGSLRELYMPTAATAQTTKVLAAANHRVQIERLLTATGTDDTAEARIALGGWLALVEYTARSAVDATDVSRERLLAICLSALESVLGRPLSTI